MSDMTAGSPDRHKQADLVDRVRLCRCSGRRGHRDSLCQHVPALRKAKAAGAAVEVDISGLKVGEKVTVEWRGKPVWILKRSPEQVAELPKLDAQLADPQSKRHPDEFTPKYAQNEHRSIKPDVLVVVGICTHLGCSPVDRLQAGPQPSLPNDWEGGFLCPCHGSTFDLAGRVFKNKPAPDNLPVPPHMYLSDTKLLIGEDSKKA